KQAEAEKQKQAELKRRQEEERKKAEAEAERKRVEVEARKKREEEAERRKAAEESLKQQLAEEERARAEAASEAERYRALIRQKVSRNWARPAGTNTTLKCIVRVRLAPGGDVLQAAVVKGSGNAVFDRSVEAAVYKASPLPIPAAPDLFEYFREIEFLFTPEP